MEENTVYLQILDSKLFLKRDTQIQRQLNKLNKFDNEYKIFFFNLRKYHKGSGQISHILGEDIIIVIYGVHK